MLELDSVFESGEFKGLTVQDVLHISPNYVLRLMEMDKTSPAVTQYAEEIGEI